ncbi:MAG: hypothetical protein ACLSVD_01200 [Eggerthellaceae bacterium]
MLKYILKRILMVIPVLLGVTVIIFLITRVLARTRLRWFWASTQRPGDGGMARRQRLDDPIWLQYINFIVGALQGNLGTSYYTHQPVTAEIAARSRHRRAGYLRHHRGVDRRRGLGRAGGSEERTRRPTT